MTKFCKKCRTEESPGGWWKCCPVHTSEAVEEDVVCYNCMIELHAPKAEKQEEGTVTHNVFERNDEHNPR